MTCPKFGEQQARGKKTLWVFIDESGDFNFTPSGSPFYTFTALWGYSPLCMERDLSEARYGLLAEGSSMTRFHACYDGIDVRKAAFDVIRNHTCFKVAAIVVRKNRTNPAVIEPEQFYPKFLDYLLKFVLKGDARHNYERVMIVTDRPPTKSIRKALKNALRLTVRRYIANGATFEILHHDSSAHAGLQAADYCCWAINRKWTGKGDEHYIQAVRPRMDKQELDVFARGNTDYY